MNKVGNKINMKTFLKTTQVMALAFVFAASYVVPQIAQASLLDGLGGFFGGSSDPQWEVSTCDIEVNYPEIYAGESVTVSWEVNGLDNVEINGQTMSDLEGQLEFTNITVDTIFELEATGDNGRCTATVEVVCLPPPEDCKLEVDKTVNKTNAVPGDEITYSVTVENTGTTDCTGGGVKIVDELHDYVQYLSHTTSGDISGGYGNEPVYNSNSRTLYFNGHTLTPGETVGFSWTARVLEPTQCGDYEVTNQAKATAAELNNFHTWSYSPTVTTYVDNDCDVPVTSCVDFSATPNGIMVNETSLLKWETANASRVTINNGIGDVDLNGDYSVSPTVTTTYILSVYDGNNNVADTCETTVTVSEEPILSCDSFTATPTTIKSGESSLLEWQTSNASRVTINNGIGVVVDDGNKYVSPLTTTTYLLTVFDGNDSIAASCEATVIVEPPEEIFTCADNVTFTANPNAIAQGGASTLTWTVVGADSVSVNPGNFSGLTGSESVSPTGDTTYTLTANKGDKTIECTTPIVVEPPVEIFSCENNVTFTANDYSITRGQSLTLNWAVSDADSVSVNPGNFSGLTGSESVSPSADTTYDLVATKGNQTISCPLTVDVSSGGGGGGSSSPRCELEISDTKISRGEEITLTWDTSRATEVTLVDDRGEVVFTTDDMLSDDKEDYYDGSIDLKPTRDTKYTLIAERGSRDRDCEVEVEIDDPLTVLETRNQQPLVAGIALSNVPYTGFEAGPVLTMLFYMLLMAWALYIAYLLVLRQQNSATQAIAMSGDDHMVVEDNWVNKMESVRPDVFAPTAVAASTATAAPANLPTAKNEGKTVGYENYFGGTPVSTKAADTIITELENRAHEQKALLSSDAIEYFMKTTEGEVERNEALDEVIAEAKGHYPLEDGWIVINQARMQSLCETCVVKPDAAPSVTGLPQGSGSLAEAIVTGNVAAAYAMIGNRPMFSLADAAADLDSVVRARQGKAEITSELLKSETAKLSDEQIKNMIGALTGALDGTYTDEASAVKMAIMKAVKEVV